MVSCYRSCWLLVVDYRLLIVECWLLVVGQDIDRWTVATFAITAVVTAIVTAVVTAAVTVATINKKTMQMFVEDWCCFGCCCYHCRCCCCY